MSRSYTTTKRSFAIWRPQRRTVRSIFRALLWLTISLVTAHETAEAQAFRTSAAAWGQTYRPAGLVNVEGRVYDYPWIRAEAQVWAGVSPHPEDGDADVVILSVDAAEPSGHARLRAGRFVLATGAVRPVHLDGGYVQGRIDAGTALEVFGGVPVRPRFAARAYDWLAGARLSQRILEIATVGVSYLERREAGREIDEEVGADVVIYPLADLTLSARSSFDLVSRGLSEVNISTAWGGIDRRIEPFFIIRNPSLMLPATSLFSVLSDAPSTQAGTSARLRVAPRLRLDAIAAYRGASDAHGARVALGGQLWLDDEGAGALEGRVTRDGVAGAKWTGLATRVYRDVLADLRLTGELEIVLPDEARNDGALWPWGRLSARYSVGEHWRFSAGAEGSASPQFQRLFQALVRVSYEVEAS